MKEKSNVVVGRPCDPDNNGLSLADRDIGPLDPLFFFYLHWLAVCLLKGDTHVKRERKHPSAPIWKLHHLRHHAHVYIHSADAVVKRDERNRMRNPDGRHYIKRERERGME